MKKAKRISIIVLMILLVGGSVNASDFTDVNQGDWYYDNVIRLVDTGIVKGYPDGTFKPNGQVTKAEFIKMIIENQGATDVTTTDHWASGYINKAIEQDLIEHDEISNPDEPINRGLMAKIVSKSSGNISTLNHPGFDDIDNSQYIEYISDVVNKNLITGYEDNTFRDNDGLTRAEASTVIVRLIEASPEEHIEPPREIETEEIDTIKVGIKEQDVINLLGQPQRKDASESKHTWYVYNEDLTKFIMVGIHEGVVTALFTTSSEWEINGYTTGEYIDSDLLENAYGTYKQTVQLREEEYTTTMFLDTHEDNKITSILIQENNSQGAGYTEDIRKSYELQMVDLTNIFRINNGESVLTPVKKLNTASRLHSEDMDTNNFFAHKNLKGQSPTDRALAQGYKVPVGENISAGYPDAFHSMHGLYNSPGHRKNILGDDYEYIGTGYAYGVNSTYRRYYTQKFSW